MAIANATVTHQRVCPLQASNYYQRRRPLQMRREHTNVCAHCKLRIIIREATAWPLQTRREHTNVCVHCKLRIIIRETTAWPLEMRRDVPTVSSELLSEKQRHGNCKCDGKHTNVCAHWKLRIIIRETTAWPLEMRRETHQRVCPM
jgi:hypothetical protein